MSHFSALFQPARPSLPRKPPAYPPWDIPERPPPRPGEYRMTCADYRVSDSPSQRALKFRRIDTEVDYRVIHNDCSRQALMWLLMARNIFNRQLTNMPEHYITRLVFSDRHWTLLLIRQGAVFGGITFRPFPGLDFAEIAFCAIASAEQMRGYGSHAIARLKGYLQGIGIGNILMYADNTALGFFLRQGFTREINFDPARWRGCIRDYEGATLIHCRILPDVDFLRIHDIIAEQKKLVVAMLPDYEATVPGTFPLCDIRGITVGPPPPVDLRSRMRWIVEKLKTHSHAWPFLKPVTKDIAPQYYEIITEPMDLGTLEANV
jgi:histone acetyltransferase